MEEKIAIIDGDGPLLDFVSGLCNALDGCPPKENFHTYNLRDTLGDILWDKAKYLLASYTFWFSLPITDDALESVDIIRQLGFSIKVATAPWRSCIGWEDTRRRLLKKYFNIKEEDVIIISAENKYLLNGDVFIDDKESTVNRWVEYHPEKYMGYIFACPWNKSDSIFRLNWKQIIEDIRDGL